MHFQTGGGGGYGPPSERDPERVREDVIDGYVSKEQAVERYGVVVAEDGDLDREATTGRREAMRADWANGESEA
jgi:N-methylhydantoinase B